MLFSRTHPSTFPFSGTIAHAGVFEMAVGARVPKSRTHAYAQTVRHESQVNETAEGCAPRWSRVFSRHHRSSLHPSFASTVFLRFLAPPSSLPFLPSLPPGIPTHAGVFEMPKFKVSARRHLISVPESSVVKTASNARRTIKRHARRQKKPSVSADSQLVPKPVLVCPKQA